METLTNNHAHVLVWLLMVYQMYAQELPVVSSLIRTQRVADLGFKTTGDGAGENDGEDEEEEAGAGDEESKVAGFLSELVESLLKLCPKLTEDAYLQCIKSIAAINRQFPPLDVVGSTEVR